MNDLITTPIKETDLFYAHMLEGPNEQQIDMQLVKKLITAGFSERYVKSLLGIENEVWAGLKKKYPRFKQLLENWVLADKEGIAIAMKQKAKGMRYTEIKRAPMEVRDENTGQMVRRMVVVEETEKFVPPDVGAGKFLLTNIDGEEFKDKQVHEVRAVNSYEQDLLAARKRLAGAKEGVKEIEGKAVVVDELPEPKQEEDEVKVEKVEKVKTRKIDMIGLEGLL